MRQSEYTAVIAVLLAAGAASPALAQAETRGKRAGDLVIGLGTVVVLPQSGGRTVGDRRSARPVRRRSMSPGSRPRTSAST